MARRFSGFRQRLVSQGRKTFWFQGAYVNTNLPSANSAVIVTSLNAAALALRPFTIIRTRGAWGVRSDQSAASENQFVNYGSIVVSDQAVAIGVTAVPTPVTDDQSSWIHFEQHVGHFLFVSGIGVDPRAIMQHQIDSKAMRKVEEGQDLINVLENSGISNGAQVVTFQRVLIKLH